MITQQQYNVCFQSEITQYIKIDLLNENDIQIDSLQGRVTDGSINMGSDTEYRRTCDIKMFLEKELLPSQSSRIWLNKRFRVHIGILDLCTDEIVWFDEMGIFIIDNPSINISISDRTISIKGYDKMFLLKGDIGKGLLEDKFILETNVPLHEAMRLIITNLSNEKHYMIDKSDYTIPYKIEKSPTDNCYTLLKEINDLYMDTEIYYDEKGYFRYGKIKNKINDTPIFTIDKNIDIRVNSSTSYDFHNVRNYIKVLGRMNDKTGIQVKSIKEITDTTSPFHKDKIGRRSLVIDESKYSTQDQCDSRANYELMLHSNLNEEISFTIPCLYFLNVNKIIEFKDLEDQGLDGKYLIKSINFNLKSGSTMSVNAKKIY